MQTYLCISVTRSFRPPSTKNRGSRRFFSPVESDEIRVEERGGWQIPTQERLARTISVIASMIIAIAVIILVVINVIIPEVRYNDALSEANSNQFDESISILGSLNGYKNSYEKR